MLALRVGRKAAALPSAALHTSAIVSKSYSKNYLARRSRQAAAFAKAKSFAKAVGGQEHVASPPMDVTWPESSVPPNEGLSLDDLLAYKPQTEARPTKGNYAEKHAELYTAIDNAFIRKQLYTLAEELKIRCWQRITKDQLIRKIMDSWGWVEPPLDVEPQIWTKHINVSTSELFLLQRDKEVTTWIGQLEGVTLGVTPDHSGGELQGWILEAKGEQSNLEKLEAYFDKARESHTVVKWPVDSMRGFTPSRATLWAISIATGAHVEPVGWGKYMATGKSLSAAYAAKKMVLTIAARATAPYPRLGACIPIGGRAKETPELYALMPHVPATSSPLPWDVNAAAGGRPLFRLVNSDTSNPGVRQARHRSAKLDQARVEALGDGEATNLSSVVERTTAATPSLEGAEPTVTFQLGHLLVPSTSDAEHGLEAPIPGSWSLEPTSPWHKLSAPIFSPAIPPALVHFPLPAPRRIRRVTYLARTGVRVSAEYAYPTPVTEAPAPKPDEEPAWIHRLDSMLAGRDNLSEDPAEVTFDFKALSGLIEEETPAPDHPMEVIAHQTTSAVEDILFPDRPTDMRILIQASKEITLPTLSEFFDKVHETAHDASKVPLTDLKCLLKGKKEVVAKPAPPVESELETEWSRYDDEPPEEEEVEVEAEPAPSPPELPDIVPPPRVEVDGVSFYLERDEVIELSESVAPPSEDGEQPILRTLAVADLTGSGGVARYAEIEGVISTNLWRELANATREVPPTSLGQGVRM